MRAGLLVVVVALASTLVGCGAASAPQHAIATPDAFVRAADRIAALEAALAHERTATVRLELTAPYLPGGVAARGAVAVRPPRDLRMVLLGPGGATSMDVWISGDRYRMEIPALERVQRGDVSSARAADRGLPIGFLRWWLLRPFAGRLYAARDTERGLEVLLRDEDAWIELTFVTDGSIEATRRTSLDVETVRASRSGCADTRYAQSSTKLEAAVVCEAERDGAAPRAFVEPCDGESC